MESRRIRDRYRLLEPIGGGAMGTVWRAHDERLDRTVAIKELLLPFGGDEQRTEDAKNRAMREARIAARLQHSHAITVFAVLDEEDRPWLIMEYLASKSFAIVLHEKPASVDTAIDVGAQVSSALAAAHRVGIVHRDVKPANILVGEDGTTKITDFGISRAIGDVKLTATGEIAGTPAYLAPEVARGEDADFASDVFSLGATLYVAVEGKPPYGTADNPIALLYRASSGEIAPPEKAGRLTPLLTRMLAADSADRPSMAEVARELAALKAGDAPAPTLPAASAAGPVAATVPAAPTVPEVAEVSAGGRRGLVVVGAGAALLCIAVVVAILLVVRQRPPQDEAAQNNPGPLAAAPAASSQPSPSPAPATLTPSSAVPTPTKPTVSTVASAKTAGDGLTEYYNNLIGNLNASFARLTSNFKVTHGQTPQTYASFWGQYRSVSAQVVSENGNTVTAKITYVATGGKTSTEQNTYTLIQEGGTWLVDTQRRG